MHFAKLPFVVNYGNACSWNYCNDCGTDWVVAYHILIDNNGIDTTIRFIVTIPPHEPDDASSPPPVDESTNLWRACHAGTETQMFRKIIPGAPIDCAAINELALVKGSIITDEGQCDWTAATCTVTALP